VSCACVVVIAVDSLLVDSLPGATLEEIVDKTTGETMVAIRSLADKGTARTSGMLKVGDIITRVDKQHCSKMPPEKVQALLYGEAGTLVKIKYIRPPGEFEMTCTLTRERGNEHQLQEKHSGWKKQDLANNEAKEAEARRRANNVNHGYIKINEHAVRHKEDKMTKDELAEYFARQRAEHEANIRAADKYVAGLEALDERERKAKAERWAKENPGARSNPFAKKEHRAIEEARWQYEHVLGWKTRTQDEIAADQAEKERLWREKKARDESTFWNPFARMSSPEREGGSHLFGANEHHKKQWWDFFPEHKVNTDSMFPVKREREEEGETETRMLIRRPRSFLTRTQPA
jgi:hypothetical protein